MPKYIITKRIEASSITEALAHESDAQIVEVTDLDEPENLSGPIGFGCG